MLVITRWKSYWFRPGSLLDLAICRIVCVAAQLFLLVKMDLYNHNRLLELSGLPDSVYDPLPVLRLLMGGGEARPPVELLIVVYGLTLIFGALALIGFKTNLTLLLFALGNIFSQAFLYSFGVFYHPEALMMITLLVLALSPAGRVLSVDALRRRRQENSTLKRLQLFSSIGKKSVFASWPLILVRYMLAMIYLDAAVRKLSKAGLDWMNGYTLQYYLLADGLSRGSDIGVWLGQQHALAWILSWIMILFEGTFFLTLFFPGLVALYIPLGIVLHTGMCVTKTACFYQFFALYSVFVPWLLLFKILSRRLTSAQPSMKPEILFDGKCPLCIRSITVIRYFDWFDRLAFSDFEQCGRGLREKHPRISLDDCRREMHLLLADGSVRKGFFAFRRILGYLPALWPLWFISYLPGASTLGPTLYRRIAFKRFRCDAETCAVQSTDPRIGPSVS